MEEQRRLQYSTASPGSVQIPDVRGPDEVLVTMRVEPAVDRLRRWRRLLFVPPFFATSLETEYEYRLLPALVQRRVLRDRWVVDIEADSGERCRVPATDRQSALGYARRIRAGIEKDGVGFLRTFAS